MGFARADIDRAMRAAYFNPDRAVEYLLNVRWPQPTSKGFVTDFDKGIPESARQDDRPSQTSPRPATGAQGPTSPSAPPGTTEQAGTEGDEPVNLFEAAAQAGQGNRGAAGSRGGTGANLAGLGTGAATAGGAASGNLDHLRNNPLFQQLRQMVQAQPQMLEPILQQIGAGNPQIAQQIAQNPEEFFRILSEDVDEDVPLPPGAQTVSVTEEEREAIERVSSRRGSAEHSLSLHSYAV